MMPQRSEHRLRYLRRGERKVYGKKTKHALEALQGSDQPVRTDPSFCLTFMKRQQAGRGRKATTFFSAIPERLPFELFMRLFNRPKRVLGCELKPSVRDRGARREEAA